MKSKLITAIRVTGLFGLYNYSLPEEGKISSAAILYGDNGAGKSTLLRLVFHLLSVANNKGHRTALYSVDYESLEVDLHSGVCLSVKRELIDKHKVLNLEIRKGTQLLATWQYSPDRPSMAGWEQRMWNAGEYVFQASEGQMRVIRKTSKTRKPTIPDGNDEYLRVLAEYVPAIFMLNAERKLDSDSVSDPSDELEIRRFMNADGPKKMHELAAKSREIALSQALASAANWIGSRAIRGANQGSMNVHSVYADVLQRILSSSDGQKDDAPDSEVKNLTHKLTDIEAQLTKHAAYEFATQLSVEDFKNALNRGKSKAKLAAELLDPYVKSLEKKLDAIGPIYSIVDQFVTTLNRFLRDKQISYKLSQGFRIQNSRGVSLDPSQLSSGEQQLLLLFCYVLTARDNPSIFMIDEPEISLNIKWQRQLVQSLLDIASGADIQFIFASHSMELLAQHRDRVVRLKNHELH